MTKKLLFLFAASLFFVPFSKAQYCLPSFSIGCTSNDIINNFSTTGGVLNISNLASGCNGVLPNAYVFNNTMTVSQTQGLSFNFNLQSGTLSQGFRIWIDWNQDYDFDDINEDVYASPGSANTPFVGVINVPLTAQPGITRMRIVCRWVTIPNVTDYCSSGIMSFGECEDYNMEVLPAAPCAGLPIAGTITPGNQTQCAGQTLNLGLTGCSVTGGLNYLWEQSTNGGVSWINVVGGFGGTGPGYLTPSLLTTTMYRCTLTCTASGLSSTTPPMTVTVTSPLYAPTPYTQDFENWNSYCDIQDVPDDNHWANTPLNGNASWRRDDEGATANWLNPANGFYTPAGSVGLHSARFHSYGTNNTGTLDLFLNCSIQPGVKTMTFDYINDNYLGAGFDSLEVLLSDNGGVSFNSLGFYNNSPAWSSHALIINSNTPNTIIRFLGYGDFQFDTDMGIDNINVLSPCSANPTAGTINPVSPCANVPFTLTLTGATIAGGIDYTWESAPSASGPWTTLGITSAPSFITTVNMDTYFRCIVTCPNNGLSSTTPVIFAPLATFYTCYCESQSVSNAQQQNIGNVSIFNAQNVAILNNGIATPLLNNPSPLNFFSNFLSLTPPPPTIYRDSTYDMKVNAFSSNAAFANGYCKIFIDYNRDGVYDPITENVGGGILNSGAQLMASTCTVPPTALYGITGMRVVYRVGGSATTTTPCGTYPSGETENYLINISLPPCVTPPNPGVATISDTITCPGYTLFLNDTGHDLNYLGLDFNWQYSSNGILFSDIVGAIYDTLSYTVGAESWFRFRITCNGTSNAYSNVLHVVMNPPFACYGQSVATGGPLDISDVGAVIFADSFSNNNIHSYVTGGPHLLNPTAIRNRTDRTSFGAMQLYADSAYKLAVYHIMNTGTHQDAKVTVFIDYNNNLVYDIPQERVFTGIADISNFYLYTYFRTPFFPALNTPTGMRVVLNNDVSSNPASDNGVGLYTSGETEDYLVSFRLKQVSPSSVENIIGVENISVYPNPSSGVVYLGLTTKDKTPIQLSVFNVTGAKVLEKNCGMVNGNMVTELNLASFAKGSYLIKFSTNQGSFVRRIVIE